jgi:general secretion pathway protein G
MNRIHGSSLLVSRAAKAMLVVVTCGLVGFGTAQVLPHGNSAQIARAKADLATLKDVLMQFRLDCDRYPTTKEGLKALLMCQPGLEAKWRGPYLARSVPRDPWKHSYAYKTTVTKGKSGFMVMSYGADGKPGGAGDNADIIDGVDFR